MEIFAAMSKKKQTELRREDVRTYQQQLAYSRQEYEKQQNLDFWDTRIFDFPIEEHEWESPHWWLNEGMRQRAARKLAKELGLERNKK
jgi:hypothetical protein